MSNINLTSGEESTSIKMTPFEMYNKIEDKSENFPKDEKCRNCNSVLEHLHDNIYRCHKCNETIMKMWEGYHITCIDGDEINGPYTNDEFCECGQRMIYLGDDHYECKKCVKIIKIDGDSYLTD